MTRARLAFAVGVFVATLPLVARAQAQPPGEGQPFFALRDLNTAQYEPDLSWQRLAEQEHQRKTGIDLATGSVSAKNITLSRRIQVNAPLNDRVRFRWHHEEFGDEEVAILTEKLELQFRVAGPVALTLFSSGALEKSAIALGGGVMIAPGDRTSYVDLAVRHDAPAFNGKSHADAEDRQPPVRLLGETNLQRGPLRFYGFADWALESRRVFATSEGSNGIRDHRRYTRRTALKLEWSPLPHTTVGVRHRFLGQGDDRRHFAGAGDDADFERTHHKLDAFGERRFSSFRVQGIAGWRSQRDRTDPSLGTDERYRRDQILAGTRAHYRLTPEIEVGAGYWGTWLSARRASATAPRSLDVYADKVDVVFGYHVNETARAELLFSHEVSAGGFGGAGGKAIFLF